MAHRSASEGLGCRDERYWLVLKTDLRKTRHLRVVVQSRDPLLRELLGDWLHRHPRVTAVVLAADGAELSRLCGPSRPDAVVIDTAPGQDTEFLLDWLRTVAGQAAVLLLVSQGAVLRQREWERAVQLVVRDDCLVTLAATLHRLGDSPHAVAPRAAELLTARELDVLRLLSLGRRSPEIGAILGVSARTVENHKRRIFAKLDVHGETQAVAESIRLGLLRHPPVGRTARLTPRESEIISLAASGSSVKQTARALNISVKTVESLQSHLFSKLGVSGRTGAVAAVYGRGEAGPEQGT